MEGVAEPGDVVFVPAGWWHLVINLEPSVALTQNFVAATNLPAVLRFLSESKGAVSGVSDADAQGLHAAFTAALQAACPDLLAAAQQPRAEPARPSERPPAAAQGLRWRDVVSTAERATFSFS